MLLVSKSCFDLGFFIVFVSNFFKLCFYISGSFCVSVFKACHERHKYLQKNPESPQII